MPQFFDLSRILSCLLFGLVAFACDSLTVDHDRIRLECGGTVDRSQEYFAIRNAPGQTVPVTSENAKVIRNGQPYSNATFSPKGCVQIPRNDLPVQLKIPAALLALTLDSEQPGQMHYSQAVGFNGQFTIKETCPGIQNPAGLSYALEPALWSSEARLKLQIVDGAARVQGQFSINDYAAGLGLFNIANPRLKSILGEIPEGDYGIQLQVESDLWETRVYPTACRLAIDNSAPQLKALALSGTLKAGSFHEVIDLPSDATGLIYRITEAEEAELSCQQAMEQGQTAINGRIPIPGKAGKYFYSVWAVDAAQNCSSAQRGFFWADDQAPQSPIIISRNKRKLSGGSEAEVVGAGAILELLGTEENISLNHCWQKIDDPVPCTMIDNSGSLIKAPDHGHYVLRLSSRDAAGWDSNVTSLEVIVDAKSPTVQAQWNVASMNARHAFIHLPYARIEGRLTVQENFEQLAHSADASCDIGFRNNNMTFAFDGVSCSVSPKLCSEGEACSPSTQDLTVSIDLQSFFNQREQRSDWKLLDKGKMDVRIEVVDAAGNLTKLTQEVGVNLFPWVPVWSLTDHRIQGLIDGSWPLFASHGPYVVDNADWVWFETNLGVMAVTRNEIKTFIDHRFFNQRVEIVSASYSVFQDPVDDVVWVLFKNKDLISLAAYNRVNQGWSKVFEKMDVSGSGVFMKLVGKRGDSLFIEAGANDSWNILELDLKQNKMVNTSERRPGSWAWNGLYLDEGRVFQWSGVPDENAVEVFSDVPALTQLWNQGEDLYLRSSAGIHKAIYEAGSLKIQDKFSPSPRLGDNDWVHHVNRDQSFWFMSYDNFPALALHYDQTVSLFSPNYLTVKRNGEQWFSDHELGILELSPVVMTPAIHSVKHHNPEHNCFTSYQFLVTEDQKLFVPCGKNLLQVDSANASQKVHSQLPLEYVQDLALTQSGVLLASNGSGVVRYDADASEWKFLSKNEGWYEALTGNMHEGIFSLVENRRFLGRSEFRLAVLDESKLELQYHPIVGAEPGSSFASSQGEILPISRRDAYLFHKTDKAYFLRRIQFEDKRWQVTGSWELDPTFSYSLTNQGQDVFIIQSNEKGIHSMLVLDQGLLKTIPQSDRLKGFQFMKILKSLRRNTVYALAIYSTEEGIYELTREGVKRIAPNSDQRVHYNHSFIDARKRIWGFSGSSQTHYIEERP